MTPNVLWLLWCPLLVYAQFDPHFLSDHGVIVQLFEWPYAAIESECETYLGPAGFGAVQISPVNEVRDLPGTRSWRDRFHPISYKLSSRSGNETSLRSMIDKCNDSGVRVFVDVILNHMAGGTGSVRGTGGSIVDPSRRDYPEVPFGPTDFNEPCTIVAHGDPHELRNCQLDDRPDLNLGLARVRQRIVDFLNRLIGFGVAGFFVDSVAHMWPHDLGAIYGRLNNLSIDAGFGQGSRPFIYQDWTSYGGLLAMDYTALGVVTEKRFAVDLGQVLLRRKPFHYFVTLGTRLGYTPRERVVTFVTDPQLSRLRDQAGDPVTVTYTNPRLYRIGLVFMMAHRYGLPRISCSYEYATADEGPPMDSRGNIAMPEFDDQGECRVPWVCEQRWMVVRHMMTFRKAVGDAAVKSWVDNGQDQVAFCRERSGFVALNAEIALPLKANVYTCLEPGTYCDLFGGGVLDEECAGTTVLVDEDGRADIFISAGSPTPFIALLAGVQL